MNQGPMDEVLKEIEAGLGLAKCLKCGCLREALDHLAAQVPAVDSSQGLALQARVTGWSRQLLPAQYACLGCEYCYGAVAQNALAAAFPNVELQPMACDFQARAEAWPGVVGEYIVLDPTAPVAVSTLGSVALAEELAQFKPKGLAIVGKTETENIGIDKIVKNIVTNPAIRFLVVAGADPAGHQSGQTLLALVKNGMDAKGRIIGSAGKRPVLRNVTAQEVAEFREQVQVVDLIGCESTETIMAEIEKLPVQAASPCG